MDCANPNPALPVVSVVIPARNEEANLERCLRSLVAQKGVYFEILVVDDGSTDRTREIAESFTRVRNCPFIGLNQWLLDVRVLDAPDPLPEHWSGKVNAMVAGEQAAKGEWLLFTDADTEHLEGSLLTALHEATQKPVDLLSYSPEQLLTGMRQKLVMPLIFAELAARYSPRRVCDPDVADAAANGQYLLVRADAHRQIGGYTSVATELLEDVALARRYKAAGYRIGFRYGGGLVRTRMYDSWQQLRSGWTKNLALLFPDARFLARKRVRDFVRLLLMLTLSLLLTAAVSARTPHLSPAAFWGANIAVMFLWLFTITSYAMFYSRILRAHFPYWPTLLSVFGLPLFASLLHDSAKAHQQGKVSWRGRTYATLAQEAKNTRKVGGGPDGAERPSAASNPK